VVASHIGDIDVVNLLLNLGAEPNSYGDNGTTALMYAKESLLNMDKDYGLLDLLINAGAEIERCDKYGKDILYYVKKSGDGRIFSYFSEKMHSN
jgi:ankyrin repeat protein